jgi:hypothetical protein
VESCRSWKAAEGDDPIYRVRYRDPAGRQRSRSFTRKVDAERWLVEVEGAKLTGRYIDPQLVSCA